MNLSKLYLLLLVCLLLVGSVSGLGVAPSFKEVIVSDSVEYGVRIFNEGGGSKTVHLNVVGELSEYISLNSNVLAFNNGEAQKDIVVSINFKDNVVLPGEYTARLVIKDSDFVEKDNIALVGVSSRIIMVVPGEGANIESVIFVPNFVNGVKNIFSVEVTNKGNSVAEDCLVFLSVSSSLNNDVATLVSEKVNINPKSLERIKITWTPDVLSGNYLARADIKCKSVESFTENTFHIGKPFIRASNLYVNDFALGSYSLFNLVAVSEWGEPIRDVFAEIELQKDGVILDSFTSANKDFKSRETMLYELFLNTNGLSIGVVYDLFVRLNYLDKETEFVYKAEFLKDRVILSPITGMVTATSNDVDNDVNFLFVLIISIIIIVSLNVVLLKKYYKKFKK